MNPAFSWIPYASYKQDLFLQTFFLHGAFFVMTVIFALFLVLLLLNRKILVEELRLSRKTAVMLLLVFAIGFWLRNAEYNYGTHVDGYQYYESARFMLAKGLFVRDCAIGNIENCKLYEQVLYPPGYPFLIAMPSLLFGFNSLFAPIISAMLSSLTIILLFFTARKVFNSDLAGLYAASIFALFPLDLLFASTGNVRPSANFFFTLSLFLFFIALERKNLLFSCLLATSLSLTLYMHQQYVVALVALGAMLLLKAKRFSHRKFKNPAHIIVPIALFSFLSVVLFYWLFFSGYRGDYSFISVEAFYNKAPKIITELLFPVLRVNHYAKMMGFTYLINPIISVLFVMSIILANREKRVIGFLWLIFIAFFLSTTLYGYCPSGKCIDYVRFIHPLVIPISMLAGFSFWKISEQPALKKKLKAKLKTEYLLVLLLCVLFFTGGIPLKASIFKDSRKEMPTMESLYFKAVESIPNGCTIISPLYLVTVSDALPNNKRKTINLWLIFESTIPMVESEIEESDCVYLIEGGFEKELFEDAYKYLGKFHKEPFECIITSRASLEVYRIK